MPSLLHMAKSSAAERAGVFPKIAKHEDILLPEIGSHEIQSRTLTKGLSLLVYTRSQAHKVSESSCLGYPRGFVTSWPSRVWRVPSGTRLAPDLGENSARLHCASCAAGSTAEPWWFLRVLGQRPPMALQGPVALRSGKRLPSILDATKLTSSEGKTLG
jgi:hypothetical protein